MATVESPEVAVAYLDNSQCWPYLKQLVSSLFPIKDIKFNFDVGEFSVKNFKPSFYPINDPFFDDSDSPIKAYKRPYLYIFIVTLTSVQDYNNSVKSQIEAFIEKREKKVDGDDKDEWLIIYTTPKPIASEIEYKMHFDNFNLLEGDFRGVSQAGDFSRIISVFGFDQKVEIFNVTFDGLYKFSVSFIGAFQQGVQQRVNGLEDNVNTMLEFKDNQNFDFLKFFALKENVAIIFENLKMYMQAFQKYEELRGKYYEATLRKPEKLKFKKEEFYLQKGKENPYIFSMDREPTRQRIFQNNITEFDFVQYLFAQQAKYLKLMTWYNEGIERLKYLINDIFSRAIRELPEIQDKERFTAFKHIWSLQAIHGFLDYFDMKNFPTENPHAVADLKLTRMGFRHYIILHLEQLYGLLYGSGLEKIQVKSFTEEFEVLLEILENGVASNKSQEKKDGFDVVAQFELQNEKLKQVIAEKETLLEYIYEEKVKYTQNAAANSCKKLGQFQAIDCIKYKIEKNKIDTVKVEDILLMVQNYDKIKFFDISDILRIYLIRYYIQKRTYTDITVPFLKLYKHQVNIIRDVFENKGIKPLEIFKAFTQRNITQSYKIKKLEDFKLKELAVDFDETKNLLVINYALTNEFPFPLSNCKVQLYIKPKDLKKTENKTHRKSYEKYTWPLEKLEIGNNSQQIELKGKNSGLYLIKNLFLKISKTKFKISLPLHSTKQEFSIQEEKRFNFKTDCKTIEGLILENKLPTDNQLPLLFKFSDFSFKFEKIRLEFAFTSHYTVFGSDASYYSLNEAQEITQEEILEPVTEEKPTRQTSLKPSADPHTIYFITSLKCISQNSEVYDTLTMKMSFLSKSNTITTSEQSFAFHFAPILSVTPKFYNLPEKSFLNIDLLSSSLIPLQIQSLEAAEDKDLIENGTQIEPNEEFSILIDEPKTKKGTLQGVLSLEGSSLSAFTETLPVNIQDKVKINPDFTLEYDYQGYLQQAEPQYKLELDFPKAVLYQQSYVLKVNIQGLPAANAKDCIVSIQDPLNNWLIFGITKYRVTPDKETEIKFNLIPINVGEIALPKVNVYPNVGKPQRSSEKPNVRRPMLMINLQEVGQEAEPLSEEQLEIRFVNSQLVQVFSNATAGGELFSLIQFKQQDS